MVELDYAEPRTHQREVQAVLQNGLIPLIDVPTSGFTHDKQSHSGGGSDDDGIYVAPDKGHQKQYWEWRAH